MANEPFQVPPAVYEALIDWPKRLANEEPFYRRLFDRAGVRNVLDVACGTGQHAALFASWGVRVEGADASPAMIVHCGARYGESDSLHWVVRPFDQPHPAPGSFDVVVCVGNSLGLAPDFAAVERAVQEMCAAVRDGGACVIHVLNLWSLPDGPSVWQKCRRVTLDGREHILVKGVHRAGTRGFVDLIDLEMSGGPVQPRYESTLFWGVESADLVGLLRQAGAHDAYCFGSYQEEPYVRTQSTDLIVVARK